MRWWDGTSWTEHTQQPGPAATYGTPAHGTPTYTAPTYGTPTYATPTYATPTYATPTYATPPYATPAYGPMGSHAQPQRLSFGKQNSLSLTTIGVVALYIVIAVSTRVVILGILPVMLSIRAVNRKEALAPIAVVAAIVAVGIAVLALK
jgi:hypothetical protein